MIVGRFRTTTQGETIQAHQSLKIPFSLLREGHL